MAGAGFHTALTDESESDRMLRTERWGVEGAVEKVGEGDERCDILGYGIDLWLQKTY